MANSIYRATQAGVFSTAVAGLLLEFCEADGIGASHLGGQTEQGGCEAFPLVEWPLFLDTPARCSSQVLILYFWDNSPSIWVPLSIFKPQHVEQYTYYPAIWSRVFEVKPGVL
jgi:hypothetical protein